MKFILCIYVVFFFYGLILASVEMLKKTPEVLRFQQYVQIDTETGKSLKPAVSFWSKLALSANVKFTAREYVTDYPVVVLKWPGRNSSLSSLILNANMDVTPADVRDRWTYPPFSGYIDDNGILYGRGSQVIKSTSMQYYEALLRLKKLNGPRDVYMVLTPDDETGSTNGLIPFLKSKDFEEMNAGLFIARGAPSQEDYIAVLYRGKTRWSFKIECYGPSGSTSEVINSTTSADGQCGRFYEYYTQYRDQQSDMYKNGMDISNVTVINFAGSEIRTVPGVVPSYIDMYFDAYLAIDSTLCEFQQMIKVWAKKSGKNTGIMTILLEEKGPDVVTTDDNPYWTAIQNASDIVNIPFNATTSSDPGAAYIARAGYPVFGISPLNNTECLVHGVDERIDILTFYNGIQIFEEIIKAVVNIPADKVPKDSSAYFTSQDYL